MKKFMKNNIWSIVLTACLALTLGLNFSVNNLVKASEPQVTKAVKKVKKDKAKKDENKLSQFGYKETEENKTYAVISIDHLPKAHLVEGLKDVAIYTLYNRDTMVEYQMTVTTTDSSDNAVMPKVTVSPLEEVKNNDGSLKTYHLQRNMDDNDPDVQKYVNKENK